MEICAKKVPDVWSMLCLAIEIYAKKENFKEIDFSSKLNIEGFLQALKIVLQMF